MKKWLHPLLYALFAVYLAVLLRITVFRSGCFSHGFFSGQLDFVPFTGLWQLLQAGNWREFVYLFVGNLLWFMPLGAFLRWKKRPLWNALLVGALLSILIEALQYVLGSGYSELEDVLLNTVGAVLGWGVIKLLQGMKKTLHASNEKLREGVFILYSPSCG